MRDWREFPLEVPRPQDAHQFRRKERTLLELAVASQISNLLSRYGSVQDVEVTMSDRSHFEEIATFSVIEVMPVTLADDSTLYIGQIPETSKGFLTDKGAHMVSRHNEDDVQQFNLTIWDPAVWAEKRIHNERGKTVRRPLLQELYEALVVITLNPQLIWNEENDVPLVTTNYPERVADPVFESLIAQLHD